MLMAVKKAKEASFKKMDSAFATSQSAIQKVKNTDPLNGNEEQEQGNENVSIDPAHYLSKKEKKEWKRLSYTAKQRYIRQAERQLKRQKKRNGIAKTEPSSVQEKEKQAAKIFSKERKYRSNTWKEPVDKKQLKDTISSSKESQKKDSVQNKQNLELNQILDSIKNNTVIDSVNLKSGKDTVSNKVINDIKEPSLLNETKEVIDSTKIPETKEKIDSTFKTGKDKVNKVYEDNKDKSTKDIVNDAKEKGKGLADNLSEIISDAAKGKISVKTSNQPLSGLDKLNHSDVSKVKHFGKTIEESKEKYEKYKDLDDKTENILREMYFKSEAYLLGKARSFGDYVKTFGYSPRQAENNISKNIIVDGLTQMSKEERIKKEQEFKKSLLDVVRLKKLSKEDDDALRFEFYNSPEYKAGAIKDYDKWLKDKG